MYNVQCTIIQFTDILNADWQKAVRAMSILGLLLLIVAVVMTIMKLFVMKDKKPVLFAGIGTSFAGGEIYISTENSFTRVTGVSKSFRTISYI